MAGRRLRSAWCGAALVLCAATLSCCGRGTPPPPQPLRITVGDAPLELPRGTEFGEVIRRLSLRPHPGRLLSISGAVLDPAITPGAVLLNGIAAPHMTPLSTGDAILVVDGHDQVEGERKVVVRLPGRHLGDPQRTLGRYRIRRIRVVGAVSGEVLATRDLLRGRGVTHDEVALTFDDGPWPVQTAAVVRILERHRAPATFFMVGYLAERYPGIVRMVARAGMRIGNHSWDHPVDPPLAEMTDARVVEEIGRTQETLATLGVHSRLFRPPGGSWDIAVQRETERQGMRIVLWSVDPKDWSPNATSGRIVRRVLDAVRPGSVVLLHDGGGDRSATIRALPKIIRGIRAMGLRLVAIPNQA